MKRKIISFLLLSIAFTPKLTVDAQSNIETVTISYAGDCTIGGYKGQGTANTYSEYFNKYGGNYFLDGVRDVFEQDDITFINLEGPLTDGEATAVKKFPIKCPSEHIEVLKNSSIEVCNLSNNHIYDCGTRGFNDTIQILEDNNIGYCGEGFVNRQKIKGINIAFLGYQGWTADESLLAKIEKDITYEKEVSDIVIVMFHWGIEREYFSNETQEKIAHHTMDCGADTVIGGHPHVMQGIEIYKGKPICYSMGNFTFGANKNPSDKDTFIFQQTFTVINGRVVPGSKDTIIPCSISSSNDKNTYQPTLLTNNDFDRVMKRLSNYSSKYQTSEVYNEN